MNWNGIHKKSNNTAKNNDINFEPTTYIISGKC